MYSFRVIDFSVVDLSGLQGEEECPGKMEVKMFVCLVNKLTVCIQEASNSD